MIFIIALLALLNLYAGMTLLARARREILGTTFIYVSRFIIGAGFLFFIGAAFFGIKGLFYKPKTTHVYPIESGKNTKDRCDHTCVQHQNVNVDGWRDVGYENTNKDGRFRNSMYDCNFCRCCNEQMPGVAMNVNCCEKETGCCGENGDSKERIK